MQNESESSLQTILSELFDSANAVICSNYRGGIIDVPYDFYFLPKLIDLVVARIEQRITSEDQSNARLWLKIQNGLARNRTLFEVESFRMSKAMHPVPDNDETVVESVFWYAAMGLDLLKVADTGLGSTNIKDVNKILSRLDNTQWKWLFYSFSDDPKQKKSFKQAKIDERKRNGENNERNRYEQVERAMKLILENDLYSHFESVYRDRFPEEFSAAE